MHVRDWHENEHTALKRLGGDFTDQKKGWRCSLDRISKVCCYQHQKTKLEIKFHLYIGDSCHQNIKKYVTWGLKSQKFYVFFLCNPMEPFISGVHPCAHPLLPEEEPASRNALYIPPHGNRRPGRPCTSYLAYIQRLLGYEEGSIQADQIATLAKVKDRSAWRSLVVACSAAEG